MSQIDKKDNDTKRNSSDESSNDSMDDDEYSMMINELDGLNKKIESSPYNYQYHVERISLLRKCGEYDQLRSARLSMADVFPLTQELWLQWLEDEQKFADTLEEHCHLQNLFEKAIQDYICPEIWLEYIQYSIRFIKEDGGFEKIRGILNRALTAVGLHVKKGASIWEACREVENAFLITIQPAPGSIASLQQEELVADQTLKITSLFERQLAIPLLDMEDTLKEYTEWRSSFGKDTTLSHQVNKTYNEALKMLEELTKFENDLEDKNICSLDTYTKYIEFEQKNNDPARVQCIYERAIADNCLNSELWNSYLAYLNKTLKCGPLILSAYERAVRNCPWTSTLWQNYLLALERSHTPYEKIEDVYKEALQVGFSSAPDYSYLFQTWCDVSRRHFCDGIDKDEFGKKLRSVFENVTSYLSNNILPAFGTTGDPDYTLWFYWARCEAYYLNNIIKSRQIIDALLENDSDARRNWKIWQEYYDLEKLHGDIEHCRVVLQRAVQSSAADDGGAELACKHFIRFERENGKLEDLDNAKKKVEGRMAKVKKRQEKKVLQVQKSNKWEQNKQIGRNLKKKEEPRKLQMSRKRHAPSNELKKNIPEKSMKTDVIPLQDAFKTPTLPARFSKSQVNTTKETKQINTNVPPGFKQNDESHENEDKIVFLSNLGYEVESLEEKLNQIFSPCGDVISIRLVRNNKGNFRGFAYIEFNDKLSAEKALKLDRTLLEGRPMFVSPNVDKTKHPDFKIFKYSKGLEKHKLFVSGLCFDTTEKKLKEFFTTYGLVKSVRIVTSRNGKSKGLAYIEFENETDAAQALIKTDQSNIDGFTIKVALSNPPARNRPFDEAVKSLGGGVRSQVVGGRGRGRTQVSFYPRSLQKKSSSVIASLSNANESGKKQMSNEDFAKLLKQ